MKLTLSLQAKLEQVSIPSGNVELPGELVVPPDCQGAVLFAHGSGSSRHSSRNQMVARTLQDARLATLLLDLLIPSEADDRWKVFDIELLADRLVSAMRWLRENPTTAHLRQGLFGASTGAAAAFMAAAREPHHIAAVVSRGGRPDLAVSALPRIQAPTLLIVGGHDSVVLHLNRQALEQLRCRKSLIIIAEATHLFSEEGALEQVAEHAREWFTRHFVQPARNGSS